LYRAYWVNFGCVAFYLFGTVLPCFAQITQDGSMGGSAGQSIPKAGDEFTIRADMGQQKDNNLFHSFGKFNLDAGEIATFNDSGASGLIDHIFARITGGEVSNINGTLRTQFNNTNPDLYLINPQGIIFGPNAKLDVQGSFHASTSNFIQLEDGVRFNAAPESDQLLSSAPPSAFGFLEASHATIQISGSDLRVPEGRSLSIIANKTKVLNGKLDAPNGHINIRHVAPHNTLAANSLTQELFTSDSNQFTPPADFEAQDIYIRSGNLIIAGGAKVGQAGGDISIAVENLALEEGGRLDSSGTRTSDTAAGNINIQARNSVDITGHLAVPNLPDLKSQIKANVALNNPNNKAGNIHITSPIIQIKEGAITANAIGAGIPGEIYFQTSKLTLQDGATIATTNLGAQQGGHVTIDAKDSILIDGINSNINSVARGDGDAGQITISTQQLTIQNSGQISTAVEGNSSTGNAGSINLQVDELRISEDGLISATTRSEGRGGNIEIHSSDIALTSQGKISAESHGAGQSGNINIYSTHIELAQGGKITAESHDIGQSGHINITANDSFHLRDKSYISLTTNKVSAGDINLDVKHLLHLSDDSAMTTSAQNGTGNGGNILIGQKVSPEIVILDKTSYIIAQAKKGNGGDIHAVTDHFFGAPENINASSALGIDGQVGIATVTSDVVASTQKLPESYVDAAALIQTPCASQTTEHRSSLVVAPRDGRLASPDGLLSSRLTKLEPSTTALPEKKFNDSPYEYTGLAECQHALPVKISAQN